MNRAALIPAKFAKLVIKQTPIPTPKNAEILVKIHSAAFNPVDYKIQQAGRFYEEFPRVLGCDVAGTIDAVGPDQKKFKTGDRVFTFIPVFSITSGDTSYGAFQQYTLTHEIATGTIPSNTSFDSASTIPLALATAADGFYNFFNLPLPQKTPTAKDEYLLIWSGASAVGRFAIQLGVASGYKVITTSSPQWHDDMKSLGASHTFDYRATDVVQQINNVTQGSLKLIYDAISSAESVKQTIELLPHGGKAAYTQLTPETAKVDCPTSIEYTRVFAGTLASEKGRKVGEAVFDWASEALADGRLVGCPVKIREGGVDTTQETFDYYSKNGIQNAKYVMNP